MTPSELPLHRLTNLTRRAWKRAYQRVWWPLLQKEHLLGSQLFHRHDRPGWHSWKATGTSVWNGGIDRLWECKCGATTYADYPVGRPTLGDGEGSGWPLDVYETVAHLIENQ